MSVLRETLGQQGWPGGVVTATDPALLGPTASPRGRNSALAFTTAGVPYVQKRKGLRMRNATPITGSPALIGQYGYVRLANSTTYHLLVSDTGRIDKLLVDDSTANLTTTLTTGVHYPDFATANDLAFIVNGVDKVKFDGTSVTNFGITRPTVGTLSGAAGAAGSPNGTYELRVTFANTATGTESSASNTAAATVTVVNQQINWSNIPVSADAQVTTVYLYVRNTATQTQFYRAGSVSNGTTTATTNFLDANLVTAAPGVTTNDPPPAGIKYLAYHQGRLFAATDTILYYSNLNAPENFNPLSTESVNASDGQAIRGLISDHEVLKILKEDATYILIGPNPNEWEVRLVDPEIGCASHRTLLSAAGATWWWSRHGLARMGGSTGPVERVGLPLYGDPALSINYADILTASAAYSENETRLYVALPFTGQARASFILPFNLNAGGCVMESDFWDPMDAASFGEVPNASNIRKVYLGNYAGQVFTLWDTNNDGIRVGTTATGTALGTSSSQTVFTAVGSATFDTTGGGLVERKVTILDSSDRIITTTRPRITANTATTFTVTPAVTGLGTGATYTFIIGGPDFQWDTPWRGWNQPWTKKRFEYFWMLNKGVSFGSGALIEIAFDYDDTNLNARQQDLESNAVGGVWDNAIWDVDVWDSGADVLQRFRVGRVGRVWRARVRNGQVDQPFALLYLAMQAVTQTVKN